MLGGAIGSLTVEQSEQLRQIISLEAQYAALDIELTNSNTKLNEQSAALEIAGEQVGIYSEATGEAAVGQENVSGTAAEATQKVKDLQQSYLDAKKAARDSIDSQVGLFNELKVESDLTAEEIVKNWQSQQAGFDQYKKDLQKAVELGLDETLVKQLSDGSTESMAILHNLVTDTDLNVDDFNKQFKKTEEAKETVSGMMATMQTELSGKFSEMATAVSNAWGDMEKDTRMATLEIQGAINRLYGKTVYIDVKA